MRTARRPALTAVVLGVLVSLLPVAGAVAGPLAGHGDSAATPPELTLVYVYRKLDATAAASWSNSGTQRLVLVRDGHTWTRSIDVALLPEDVCGSGWAVQEDQTRGLARRDVPAVVDRATGVGVLGWPPVVAARHRELADLVPVPACEPGGPTPPPVVTPSPEPTQITSDPPFEPPAPPVQPQVPTPGAARPALPVVAAPSFTG